MITSVAVLFWLSVAVTVYIYFGYPLLLWILSRARPRPVREGDYAPRASFIIPAFNEEKLIGAKIENTLALDYPAEQLEVIVVSNGSTDATEQIVRNWGDPRVRLIALQRPGKMEALNEGVRAAVGEIVVFSDADFLLDPHTLRLIGRKFNDPEVGGVCGARKGAMTRDGDSTGEGEGLYGRWDRWQKIRESEIGSVFAADGLLYAIRRALYVPITDPAQADDIAISVPVVFQGYRLLFEPEATAWENSTVVAGEEFQRKVRVTNHSVRALLNLRPRLLTSGFYSVELLSHKLIRHFIPIFLLLILATNILLLNYGAVYQLALAGQLFLYGLAIVGAVLRDHPVGRVKLFYVPYFFCFVNAAAFFGILAIARGDRLTAWSTRAA